MPLFFLEGKLASIRPAMNSTWQQSINSADFFMIHLYEPGLLSFNFILILKPRGIEKNAFELKLNF